MFLVTMVATNWILGLYVLLRAGAPETTPVLKVSVPQHANVIQLRRRPLRLAAA